MPDVVAPEGHQNDRSYVSELSGPTFDPLHKNLSWWAVTRRTSKNPHNCQNWEVGACTGMGACLGQYGTKDDSITALKSEEGGCCHVTVIIN